ncbi:MAG: DUF11 domain-containing protein [Candidatus Nomurabacteria bacterium]|jgi:uncharacterized repeat protein (TIGR01451 family)|nr:DUF11 domain-containing protein [Candidatus Nomurabacteria bacterium]
MKKFFKFAKYIPKKAALVLALLAATLIPAALWAWGPSSRPTYTMAHPADHVTFDSITDNPVWGDERTFIYCRDHIAGAAYEKCGDLALQSGQTYDILAHYHNDAASNLDGDNVNGQGVAHGAYMRVEFPGEVNGQANGNIYIGATNANPTQIWDTINFTSSQDLKLNVVSGSAQITSGPSDNPNPINGESGAELDGWLNQLVSKNGALLGWQSLNGILPGCTQYSGYVQFQIRTSAPTPVYHPAYDVSKTVDKSSAKPGDTLQYTLTVKNTGDEALTNVVVKDSLPGKVSYVENSLTVKDKSGATVQTSGDLFGADGLKIANLPVGAVDTITFRGKVADAADFDCTKTTPLTNTVSSTTDQDKTETDTTNNSATTNITTDCPVVHTPNFDLSKTVDKTSAAAGDTLNYTLTFKNTGDETLTNVVIKDTLPKDLTLQGQIKINVNKGGGISDLDKLFTTGVKIAKVEVGGVVKITFSAKVNSDDLVCGENVLTNTSSATTTEKTTESNTTNNSATTDIDKVCPTPTPPTPITPPTPTNPATPVTPTTPAATTATEVVSDLPSTGAATTTGGILGGGALTYAGYSFLASRKKLGKIKK